MVIANDYWRLLETQNLPRQRRESHYVGVGDKIMRTDAAGAGTTPHGPDSF